MDMSIENITQKILSEAKESAEVAVAQAHKQGQELIAKAQADAAELEKRAQQQMEQEHELILQRRISVAELEARKMRLAAKQEVIARSFEEAMERLANLNESEYIAFLADGISEAAENGSEVLLNARDREAVGEKVITLVRAMGKEVTLSEETIRAKGGFILRCGAVELNATLETMVGAVREEVTPQVVQALFG